eukprot:4304229-Pleurochrysis_carterae.AAC.1
MREPSHLIKPPSAASRRLNGCGGAQLPRGVANVISLQIHLHQPPACWQGAWDRTWRYIGGDKSYMDMVWYGNNSSYEDISLRGPEAPIFG